ncbi:hypothetical protein [Streptomyces salinarius]|uniref:hypothetical protein n=1 Tax=Streptomyces salinarius TaxID=2762598 RepID=UPI001647CAD3|nr:hypothetical protein [Streptomyces salinarius]
MSGWLLSTNASRTRNRSSEHPSQVQWGSVQGRAQVMSAQSSSVTSSRTYQSMGGEESGRRLVPSSRPSSAMIHVSDMR